jgi:hypothetical protein
MFFKVFAYGAGVGVAATALVLRKYLTPMFSMMPLTPNTQLLFLVLVVTLLLVLVFSVFIVLKLSKPRLVFRARLDLTK